MLVCGDFVHATVIQELAKTLALAGFGRLVIMSRHTIQPDSLKFMLAKSQPGLMVHYFTSLKKYDYVSRLRTRWRNACKK